MLCSRCSEVIKPVVALDIDGTLGDWHTGFLDFADIWLGCLREVHYDGSEPFREWFKDAFGVDDSTFRTIKLAYRQSGLKRVMSADPHARTLVTSLRGIGAEVWLTTTRPHDRFDRIDPDTREWLRRNEIPFDGLIYDDRKMQVLAERVDPERVCFVLDDLVPTLEFAQELFPNAGTVLRLTTYNGNGPHWMLMTSSLLDARAMATAHIQDWAARHAFDDLPTTHEGDER